MPPRPVHAPEQAPRFAPAVADWLNEPRPVAAPGIWRYGYRPPKADRASTRLTPVAILGLLVPLVVALIVWSFWRHGAVPYQWALLKLFTPSDWWWAGTVSPKGSEGGDAINVYDGVFFALLVYAVVKLGGWLEVARHVVGGRLQPARALLALVGGLIALSFVFPSAFPGIGWRPLPVQDPVFSLVFLTAGPDIFQSVLFTDTLYALITVLVLWPFARLGGWWGLAKERLAARGRSGEGEVRPAPATVLPAQWPQLREAGQYEAAELLTAEVLTGRMNDVDCARVGHAWETARKEARVAAFSDTVLRKGAAAWVHPSGARDLPGRAARHDLLDGQVRIGQWTSGDRTPSAYRGAGTALGPETLGTSSSSWGRPAPARPSTWSPRSSSPSPCGR